MKCGTGAWRVRVRSEARRCHRRFALSCPQSPNGGRGGGEGEREEEGREDGREREEGEEERVKRVWMKGRRGKGGWREG